MTKKMMEVGQIVNTHGIRGEIKIQPWCDSPDFLLDFDTYYIDSTPYRVTSSRVHKFCVLASLSGVDTVNAAMVLKNKVVSIDRSNVTLPEGKHFIADLIGLDVVEEKSGQVIGKLADVLTLPAQDVYVVRGDKEYMIPAVKEFIHETDLSAGRITVSLIPGMETGGGINAD